MAKSLPAEMREHAPGAVEEENDMAFIRFQQFGRLT